MIRKRLLCMLLGLLCLLSAHSAVLAEDPLTPQDALALLRDGHATYLAALAHEGDISPERRADTAEQGQAPYAVVLTCSDSRVPPEHIFMAGIGDLFVIRTAGHVVGEYELGSVEYGVLHLGAPLVVVLGHDHCGAVSAALDGHADGAIGAIVHEIEDALQGETDTVRAEALNIARSAERLMESEALATLVVEGALEIRQAKYTLETGEVSWLLPTE